MTTSVTASPANRSRPRAVLTDHPWPDIRIEQSILEDAGIDLIAGSGTAGTTAAVEALVAKHDPQAILTCWAEVSESAIRLPTALRIVARMGVGLDNIAVAAATRRGAWVTNVPDYCVEEVSDHAIALLLNAWRGIANFDREVKAGRWDPASARLRRLAGSTVGIVGHGRIGSATARKLARGFECRVLVTSPSLADPEGATVDLGPGIRATDLGRIQREADAIILHAPLLPATRHLVNDGFLARCLRRPLLINVSRGALIDNDALLRALESNRLSGAALDVVEGEPNPPAELVRHAAVTVTPHVAFSSDASLADLRRRVAQEVVRVLGGRPPLHPCNAPVPD
jgi:D-3-phosphoglycerate dehydrogenase